MPFIGGQLFLFFGDHYTTYHFLFWWQLALSVLTALIFATIPQPRPPVDGDGAQEGKVNDGGGGAGGGGSRYQAPAGARQCDLLCFGQTVRWLEQEEIEDQEVGQDGQDGQEEALLSSGQQGRAAGGETDGPDEQLIYS